MSLIETKIGAALTRCDKLSRRAETAINDGKDKRGIEVLNDLAEYSNSQVHKIMGLKNSLRTANYQSQGWDGYVKSFKAFQAFAVERLEQLSGTKGA